MPDTVNSLDELSNEDLARYVINLFHRIIMHYAFWFTEVRHQLRMDRALEVLDEASSKSFNIQMKRLSKTLGFDMAADDLPAPLAEMPREKLMALLNTVSVNWLVNDGVWFQSVEFEHGMNDAKRCNDSCWTQFSPFEAWTIKRFFNMPERPGLEGLKKALGFRLYANINQQSFSEEKPDSFVFQMNDCRVQAARKRKGLEDYPCKTAGLVEYTYFARSIDERIQTECIGCPPDPHPEEWYCAWRFYIDQ
ncbi:MAG: DUF6125 family protein [Desulfobacterales bacterium]